MKLILFIAILAVLLWTFLLRAVSVLKKYEKQGNQVILPEPMTPDALFQKIKSELQYPDVKNIFYDEYGALSVAVRRLRQKLGGDCIRTVYGLGYIWKGAAK